MSDQQQNQPDWYEKPLYKLLCKRFPAHVHGGRLNVKDLADDLGYSYENLYKWLRSGRINPKNAKKIIKHGVDATMKELVPFILA